jgi:hypothetical protein
MGHGRLFPSLLGIPVSGHGSRRRLHDPPESNALLFPDQPKTVKLMKKLKAGEIEIVRL